MGMKPFRAALPAAQGLAWFRDGIELLGRQPLRLLLLGLLLQLIAGISQVGVLGILFVLAIPALTSGMLQSMHLVRQGERPSLGTLFVAFASPPRLLPLVLFGGVMLASAIAAVGVVLSGSIQELDPSVLARLEAGDVEAMRDLDPAFIRRLLFGVGAGLMISACISYFTVPLVWFREQSLGRAIVAGVTALVRQWKAVLVLGLVLGLLAVPVATMTGMLLVAQAAGSEPSPVLTLLMLLVAVVYQLLLFSTQYTAFRAVFGVPGAGAPRQRSTEDQLVA